MKSQFTLSAARRQFLKYPSPWIILSMLTLGIVGLIVAPEVRFNQLVIPLLMAVTFPITEWIIHVFVLHWKPIKFTKFSIDSRLAKDHRKHHSNPREVPLIFIPWQSFLWIVPLTFLVCYFGFQSLSSSAVFITSLSVLGICYEWTHYLIHTDYQPKTRIYKSIWRSHRNHHYKNENYWFTVTTAGTADRLFGTYPDPNQVATSKTAKNLDESFQAKKLAS